LEALVGEHERLGEQAREMQEMAEKYKEMGEQARQEVKALKLEGQKAREQMQRAESEIRELRVRVQEKDQGRGEWENTCEDLAKELKTVQGELTHKELVFHKVE